MVPPDCGSNIFGQKKASRKGSHMCTGRKHSHSGICQWARRRGGILHRESAVNKNKEEYAEVALVDRVIT